MTLGRAVLRCACGARIGFAPPSARAQQEGFWLPAPLESLVTRASADSNDPMVHHLVALAYLNEERWNDAERRFREALTVDPRFAPSLLGLAVLPFARDPRMAFDLARGRMRDEWKPILEQAFTDYRLAFIYDPLVTLDAPDAPVAVFRPIPGWLFSSGLMVGLWNNAVRSARAGRFAPGVEDLRTMIRWSERHETADSTDVFQFLYTNDLRFTLGFFLASSSRTWEAIRTYREVLTSDFGYWMAHVRLAELHERRSELDVALQEREMALSLVPGDPTLTYELGAALSRAARLDSADVVLRAAAVANPRAALPLYDLGLVAWLRNDAAGVRDALTRFLAIAPSKMEAEITDARERLALVP